MTNVDISNDDDDIEERKETIEELNTNLDVYSIDNNVCYDIMILI